MKNNIYIKILISVLVIVAVAGTMLLIRNARKPFDNNDTSTYTFTLEIRDKDNEVVLLDEFEFTANDTVYDFLFENFEIVANTSQYGVMLDKIKINNVWYPEERETEGMLYLSFLIKIDGVETYSEWGFNDYFIKENDHIIIVDTEYVNNG